jgi:hypothetical protein
MSDVLLQQMRAFRDHVEKRRDETPNLGLRVYLTLKLPEIEKELERMERMRAAARPKRTTRIPF